MPGAAAREWLIEGASARARDDLRRSVADVEDADLPRLLGDLGGHDLHELLRAFQAADAVADRPSVLFAYTMKGWGLPFAGDPLNHSALLTQEQIDALRSQLLCGATTTSGAGSLRTPRRAGCASKRRAPCTRMLARQRQAVSIRAEDVPHSLASRHRDHTSSQEAFGNALVELARAGGPVAAQTGDRQS